MAKKSSKYNKKKYKKNKANVVNNTKKDLVKKSASVVKNKPISSEKKPTAVVPKKEKTGNVRSAVVVDHTKKQSTKKMPKKNIKNNIVPKKTTLKNKSSVKEPILKKEEEQKILEEFITVPEENKVVEENFENKVDSILEFEVDEKANVTLDDIDVLKFPSKNEKVSIKKKKSKEKKQTKDQDIASSIDEIKKLEDTQIIKEFEDDLLPEKPIKEPSAFRRKRKGKNYVINIHKTKTYKELEDNLRQLYDKVNDVVSDFDTTVEVPEIPEETIEKPILLDKISQRVLNVFLIILFIIFFLMCVAFVAFVIYVSTV